MGLFLLSDHGHFYPLGFLFERNLKSFLKKVLDRMVRIWNQPLRLEESTSELTALEDNYGHKWEKEDGTEGK